MINTSTLEIEIDKFIAQYEAEQKKNALTLETVTRMLRIAVKHLQRLREHRCQNCGKLIEERYRTCYQCFTEARTRRWREYVKFNSKKKSPNSDSSFVFVGDSLYE